MKVGAETRKEIDRLLKRPITRRSGSESPKTKKPKPSHSGYVSSQSGSDPLKYFFDSTSKDEQEEIDTSHKG